jgi:hypothetical protein
MMNATWLHVSDFHSKQGAFLQWYNGYFDGIRSLAADSTCGPVEAAEVPAGKIGILPRPSPPSDCCAVAYTTAGCG